jgi:hypothetical protein
MALVSGPTLADAIADPNNELTKLLTRENDDAKLIDDLFVRILNRPATATEIATCRSDLQSIDDDHRKLAENLGKREFEFAIRRPQLERERLVAITSAQAALVAHEKDLAPRLAQQEKDKAAATTRLETDLKAYEATVLARKMADWEKAQSLGVRWKTLEPSSLQATDGAVLTKQPDGSILASGTSPHQSVYAIVGETDLTDITGLRLEVLPDGGLPSRGPGRAPDGNFVLTEFEVLAAPKADLKQVKPVKLQTPLADFSQEGYSVAAAIDGDRTN